VSRTSDPTETVDLLRDEIRDLCWGGVERTFTDTDGLVHDVDSRAAAARQPDDARPAAQTYQLISPMPGNWYPMVPDGTRLTLTRLRGQPQTATRFLTELLGRPVPEEQVTRAGRRLTSLQRYARARDGSQVLWRPRHATPAPVSPSPPLPGAPPRTSMRQEKRRRPATTPNAIRDRNAKACADLRVQDQVTS
jgi:hypothetical protein